MRFSRSMFLKAAMALGVAVAALGSASVAQARDNVYWSVGIDAAPGVSVGVGNHRPVVVAPQPVYVQPQPVYVQPCPVYVQPRPVYVQPQTIYAQPRVAYPHNYYVQPAPVYYGPPGHWKHDRHWDD